MAKTTKEVDVFTCDACLRQFVVDTEELPDGFHGTVFEIASWGGNGTAKWFACKAAHIALAVRNVLAFEREKD